MTAAAASPQARIFIRYTFERRGERGGGEEEEVDKKGEDGGTRKAKAVPSPLTHHRRRRSGDGLGKRHHVPHLVVGLQAVQPEVIRAI